MTICTNCLEPFAGSRTFTTGDDCRPYCSLYCKMKTAAGETGDFTAFEAWIDSPAASRIGYLLLCPSCKHKEDHDMTEEDSAAFRQAAHPCPACSADMEIADAGPYYA